MFLVLFNIITSITHCYCLSFDVRFMYWLEKRKANKYFYIFSAIISMTINHKFMNILFCQLFGWRIMSAKLENVDSFKYFHIFSMISLLSNEAAILAALDLFHETTNN